MAGSAARRRRAKKRPAAKAPEAPPFALSLVPLRIWLLGAVLVAAVIFAYQPAWHAGYIWDDDAYVTANPLLTAPDGWWRIWFSFDAPSQYFPLTYSTFRIEHALWGLNSTGYHWVNILLHATGALLLWRLLRVLNVPAAWFGAALFALHPVQVESVAWVTERKNVLMGVFFFSSLLAWMRVIDDKTPKPFARRWLVLALVLFVFALSAKTTACTLPAALILILWWQRKPITGRRWFQVGLFVAAGLGAGVVSILWERVHQGWRADFLPVPLLERVLIGTRAIWFYLSKLAWPVELMFSYPRWEVSRANPADYIGLVALVPLIAAILYARRRFGRGPETAFTFFVATLSPLLAVVMVTTFYYSFVADHYQYLACIGPLALFAAGCEAGLVRLSVPGKTWLGRIGATIILAVLAFLTWQQTKMYQNEETLWLRTIAQNPSSWMARNNLAGYWTNQKRFDEAIAQYRELIELRPNEALGYMNLGAALARKGDTEAAIAEYERALAIAPQDARIERNLGQALFDQGRIDDAIAHFERALELRNRKDPRGEKPDLLVELGNAYLRKGDTATAITHYRSVLASRPNDAAGHTNLATALLKQGQNDEARRHFDEAKRLSPANDQSADVYYATGNTFFQKRDLENAIANYRQALGLRPNFAEARSNLGTALLIQGKVAEAISEFETTLSLAPESVPTLNNLARLLANGPDQALRDGARAERLARQAIDLSQSRDAASFRALGLALAEQGDFDGAEKAADEAIALADSTNHAFAEVVRREKQAYHYHEKPPTR
jgi:tetratricopeptide (TPR) repeat protein